MPEEIQEIREHAEEAHQNPHLAPVTITMSVLAVLVAAVSLLGHRAHTEEVLLQSKASDQWAYYQAKSIRRHTYELFLDLLSVSGPKDDAQATKVKEKYAQEAERYKEDQKEIEAEAHQLEKEVGLERKRADRFDLGEVCLEAALVISSITLLTRRRLFWRFGLLLGALGLFVTFLGTQIT